MLHLHTPILMFVWCVTTLLSVLLWQKKHYSYKNNFSYSFFLLFAGLGLWCFTLWCFVSLFSLYNSLHFTRKKNFLIFYKPMHWDDYRLLMSDAWRLLFFVFNNSSACICDNFNGAKSRNANAERYYIIATYTSRWHNPNLKMHL